MWDWFKPCLWRILQTLETARYCNAIETFLCISRVVVFIFNQTLGNRHSSRPAALLGSAGKREAGIHIGWASCGGRRIDETTIIVTVSSSALSPKPYKAKPRSFCQATSSIKAVCLDMVHPTPSALSPKPCYAKPLSLCQARLLDKGCVLRHGDCGWEGDRCGERGVSRSLLLI